jgi:hypothetical protein
MKNKKLIITLVAVVAVIAILLGVYFATRPETQAGKKEFTVVVIHSDNTTREFTYKSDQEYLGRALVEVGLVEDNQGPYGLYIEEVDGERAVWEENQAWWGIYIGEESAVTGADEIPLTDGGVYKLVFSVA